MRKWFLSLAILAFARPAQAQSTGLPDALPGLDKAPPFVANLVVSTGQMQGLTYRIYYD